jgi:hypothetical protein
MSVAASGASRASWHVPAVPRTRVRLALRAAGGLREHLLPFGSR